MHIYNEEGRNMSIEKNLKGPDENKIRTRDLSIEWATNMV